jgi:hypothetical protein
MTAETGVLGLGAFLWLMGRFFYQQHKGRRPLADNPVSWPFLSGMAAAVFAFLIHGIMETNFYSLQLVILFWFFVGLGMAGQQARLFENKDVKIT